MGYNDEKTKWKKKSERALNTLTKTGRKPEHQQVQRKLYLKQIFDKFTDGVGLSQTTIKVQHFISILISDEHSTNK